MNFKCFSFCDSKRNNSMDVHVENTVQKISKKKKSRRLKRFNWMERFNWFQLDDHKPILLAKGGFANVYLVKDPQTKQKAAQKCLFCSKQDIVLVHMEVHCLLELSGHPLFLTLLTVWLQEIEPEKYHVVLNMEYFDGVDLYIRSCARRSLRPNEIKPIICQLCQALIFCHSKGIIHRDVKPENVLINKKMDIKLIDFDLAVLGPKADGYGGTQGYMAPEVEKFKMDDNSEAFGYESDYFSVGATLHHLLFSCTPQPESRLAFQLALMSGMTIDEGANMPLPSQINYKGQTFLNHLLHPDPEKRLNDETVLLHPYFTAD